jgi:hypothetical protein
MKPEVRETEAPQPAKREVVKETVKKAEPKEVQKVEKRGAKVIKLFFFLSLSNVWGKHKLEQGTLTEGEGSVQLISSLRMFCKKEKCSSCLKRS